jgi:hypothetical protein
MLNATFGPDLASSPNLWAGAIHDGPEPSSPALQSSIPPAQQSTQASYSKSDLARSTSSNATQRRADVDEPFDSLKLLADFEPILPLPSKQSISSNNGILKIRLCLLLTLSKQLETREIGKESEKTKCWVQAFSRGGVSFV